MLTTDPVPTLADNGDRPELPPLARPIPPEWCAAVTGLTRWEEQDAQAMVNAFVAHDREVEHG